jgi:exosortase
MTRPLASIALLLAALGWGAFNWPVFLTLHKRWWSVGETYEIGYPLLLIALYWVFAQRSLLRATPVRPSWVGAALFLLALLLSCAGRIAHVVVVQQLMVPVSLWCAVYALAGGAMAARLLVPCGLLLAGVPIWDFLVDPLRALTVWAVQGMLGAVQIPALVQGYNVVLPAGVMIIADACSGLNLMLAAVVIGLLQASLNLHSLWRKALLVAVSVLLAIVDNWLRVFGLILIAHYTEMKHPLVYDHATFGWWLFVASLVPFFYLAHVLERGDRPQAAGGSGGSFSFREPLPAQSLAGAGLVLALISVVLLVSMERMQARPAEPARAFVAPAGALPKGDGWLPRYSGYDLAQTWRLLESGTAYDVVALTYVNQTAKRKLVYYTNHIADRREIRASGQLRIDGAAVLNETVIHAGIGGDRIVWWLYRVDGATTASAVTARLLQLRAELTGERDAAFIAVSRLCSASGCSAEREAATTEPEVRRLLRMLPQQREG